MNITTVKLNGKGLGIREFPIEHAQRILDFDRVKGFNDWELEDKKFELKDGIITFRDTTSTKKAKEQGLVGEGGIPSEQA